MGSFPLSSLPSYCPRQSRMGGFIKSARTCTCTFLERTCKWLKRHLLFVSLTSHKVFRKLFSTQFYETWVFLRLSTVRNVGGGGGKGRGGGNEESICPRKSWSKSTPTLGKGVQMANSEFAIRHLLFQKKVSSPSDKDFQDEWRCNSCLPFFFGEAACIMSSSP